MSTAISLHKIVKNYGPFRALDGVSFEVHSGELHALLGQNGAGKSTLMKILYGLTVPDSGEIRLGDAVLRPGSTKEAISAGLAFVMQHFSLIDSMSIAENLVLGQLKGAGYSPRKLVASMQDFIDRNAFELDAAAPVGSLSVGQKQRVEILKALYRKARFIIFD
ncbi:MAG TPA: ATP-binding cassette domain-containing protein, partial [Bacteroidetes bacterium]|nr:ATP-binding cassette domain-containing protein [Bacteroidota bacterium]